MRILPAALLALLSSSIHADPCVILLHGWMRSSASMRQMEEALVDAGFAVANIDYASRSGTVSQLSDSAIPAGIAQCKHADVTHFVTHSMGGILVRDYYSRHRSPPSGRVVMLGPPNQGTPVVNFLSKLPGGPFLLGPAGNQLGKGESYLPVQLPAVTFELGVIAGTQAFNPLLSLLVPAPDDGTVAVRATKVKGMCAHLTLPVTHFLMMKDETVIAQTVNFLQEGTFSLPQANNHLCTRAERSSVTGLRYEL